MRHRGRAMAYLIARASRFADLSTPFCNLSPLSHLIMCLSLSSAKRENWEIRRRSSCGSKGRPFGSYQKSKSIRDQKWAALLKEKRYSVSAPRVVVLFGLSSYANLNLVKKDLLQLLSGDDGQPTSNTIASSAYRLRTTVLEAPYGDLMACIWR